MSKVEKIITSFINWLFCSVFVGLIFGALFGGRGAIFFVFLGFLMGVVLATIKSIYLFYKYEVPEIKSGMMKTISRRFITSFLYFLVVYTITYELFFSNYNNVV